MATKAKDVKVKTKTSAKKSTDAQVSAKPKIVKSLKTTSDLPSAVFGCEKVNTQAIFDTIMMERASRRQGTHSVKTRGEVSGSGIKPWRQKGTGKARAGSLRSPHFVGGGRAFGPQTERNYNIKVNKKVRKLAFFSALTLAAKDGNIFVTDTIKLDQPKTKMLIQQLHSLEGVKDKKHVVIVSNDDNVYRSANNIPNVAAIKLSSLTVEAILWADVLIFNPKDLEILEGMAK